MPLSAGERLGPYEILEPIGAGGMGEVYKARDTRLDRTVAIKVSKTEFSERFAREARATSALNHSQICQLYDVGPNYLVLEYIEGAPLKGPLPLDQALKYAAQICDALDAAHKKTIIHRDLKPANILVTKQGIKLLDFGLAKVGPAVGADEATMTMALTGKGQILGTLSYMSPEQIGGQEADARSDIFAFGLVLYEMLTGKRAFEGSTPASVMGAIMERPAPSIAEIAPAGLDRVLKRCLEKDPENRWQTARDLKIGLELISSEPATHNAAPVAAAPARKRWLWPAIAAVLAAGIGVTAWMLQPKPAPPVRTTRFQIPLPEGAEFGQYVSLSPDGHKIAFNTVGRQNGFWIRDLDTLESKLIQDTQNAVSPFWSPDSRFLAFSAGTQLKKVDGGGGAPQTICEIKEQSGSGAWNKDGVIVFGTRGGGPGLRRVAAAGGIPTAVTLSDPAHGDTFHTLPFYLSDQKHFVYLRAGIPGLYVGSLDVKPEEQSKERILESALGAPLVNGKLFFLRQGTLMTQTFDERKFKLTGDPVPIAEHVGNGASHGFFSISASGSMAYREGSAATVSQLTWLDRDGKPAGRLACRGPRCCR